MTKLQLTRRAFVRIAPLAALGAQVKRLQASVELVQPKQSRFAFVGTMGDSQGIHVYATDGERWRLRQTIASDSPISLALHPEGGVLYVLNEISVFQGLPSGSIETYRVDGTTGLLTLLGRQALSLSATMPRQLAVTPDGKRLVVAVHDGGAYNLLPVLADGRVGRVCGIFKETGCGPVAEHQESAHPQAVIFDRTGKYAITADLGNDKLSVFSIQDGLKIEARYDLPAGSGPRHLALHPDGHLLYVANALNGSISGFRLDTNGGGFTELSTRAGGGLGRALSGALAMHPAGDFLYTADNGKVSVWRIETGTGALDLLHTTVVDADQEIDDTREMVLQADGSGIVALTSREILRMEVDPRNGRLSGPEVVASLPGARCIATYR